MSKNKTANYQPQFPNTPSRKVALLDRDGTINVDHGFVHSLDQWEFTKQAVAAIGLLKQHGFAIAVVTNQSGIATGRYSLDDVNALHEFVQHQLQAHRLSIDAFALCPHAQESGCTCRKPRTGMITSICCQLGATISDTSSWMIGDKPSDIRFGEELGVRTALIRSQYWSSDNLDVCPTIVADSLYEAVVQIVSLE